MRLALYLAFACAASAQVPCDRLASLTVPNVTITAAESRPASPTVQAHCRVAAILKPSADSQIEAEVWMPANWNGKFQAVGNGGWSGSISFDAMRAALLEGYATASTDTGHKSAETPGASFAFGHPEKLIDFGYRAIHEMTVLAKKLIEAHYGRAQRLAYWNSCSNGGRQGLMEAQRYPQDFDGIVAGAPAANWTGRAIGALWVAQIVHKDAAAYIPPAKYPLLNNAALEACDTLDGVTDGVIEDPARCKFDPAKLLCRGDDGASCLTAAQVEAARQIYAKAIDPATKREFYPGLAPGSEFGWATYGGPRPFAIGIDYARFVLFRDPAWEFKTLNAATAAAEAERVDNGATNALNPDLRPFFEHGGKLVQYHGWSDPQIPPMHSVTYYNSVLERLGGAKAVEASYRLFMVPGMQHCGGGPGTNQFNAIGALERWRESGIAPDSIPAAHVNNNRVERTRPLCPYPQTAHYTGIGSTNDAANFVCRK
jgi:feruloyl esterase